MNPSATTVKEGLVRRLKFPIYHYACIVFQTRQIIFKREKVKKQWSIIRILISISENLNALTVLFIFNWISYGKIIIVKPDFFSNICSFSLFIGPVFLFGMFYISILHAQILFLLNT